MSDPVDKISVSPPEDEEEAAASTDDSQKDKTQIMKEQDAQFQAKYGGMARPTASAMVRKKLSRGGQRFFDSGDYNKNKREGKPAEGGGTSAPLAVTPGQTAPDGVQSRLSALPKSMQRKPSGASRLGISSQSPPKDGDSPLQ